MSDSSPVCRDANMVIRLVTDPADDIVRAAWDRWDTGGRLIVAPLLLRDELTDTLHRMSRGTAPRLAIGDLSRAAFALPIRILAGETLHAHAAHIATRSNLPAASDAHSVALAERLDAEFWTTGQRLASSVGRALPWVRLAPVGVA